MGEVKSCLANAITIGLWLVCVPVLFAGPGPEYRYGELWWEECQADEGTELLLHFGAPTVGQRAEVGAAVKARRSVDQAFDDVLDGNTDSVWGDVKAPALRAEVGLPPVQEANLASGKVADYSNRRRVLDLPPGFRRVDDGRFGAGVASDGTGAWRIPVAQPQSVECWFNVAALPPREACLVSVGGDEARLLLRPDGRLELRLRKPHGNPNTAQHAPAVLEALTAREADIVSPNPVRVGEWVHVAALAIPHPAPANTGCWEAVLLVDGEPVARYLSESGNQYDFLGGRSSEVILGNDRTGTGGAVAVFDELRVSTWVRQYHPRPPLDWRDANGARPLQFDRPWFRADGTVAHASFDRGLELERRSSESDGRIGVDLDAASFQGLLAEGIRGKACTVDPEIAFVRIPLAGMDTGRGALEFWMRPRNWDDCTGYWHHSPPAAKDLSVARIVDADGKVMLDVTLPRAYNNERQRVPLDPGHWSHVVAVWDGKGWGVYVDGTVLNGKRREVAPETARPLRHVEFGVPGSATVARGAKPAIDIDEVVGYRVALRKDEVAQARHRWMGTLEPIPLYEASYEYKASIRRLGFAIVPLLPEGKAAVAASVRLVDRTAGQPVSDSVDARELAEGAFRMRLLDGRELPYGQYQFQFQLKGADGEVLAEGRKDWDFAEEPWRQCRAGILDTVPEPWVPIRAEGDRLQTRMTTYRLGPDGLPTGILADGVELLAGPFGLREDGKPMSGRITVPAAGAETEKHWTAEFEGRSCDITMQCRIEYDGMVRYELSLRPKGPLAPVAFVMPLRRPHATHWLAYPAGARGPSTGLVGEGEGVALSSRTDPPPAGLWRQFQAERQKRKDLTWEQFWHPLRDARQEYGFFTHVDLGDRDRGLWWFCDNAAGWAQSKARGAVEVVREGDAVRLELNLVAEAGAGVSGAPIVFGVLPHPARPMPAKYRLYERVSPDVDPQACDVFDAFYPWPMDPRARSMSVYPAPDPKRPAEGPSWDYAERCIPTMKSCKAKGLRTMYLSKAYFSCRAGAYDHWEWRSGEGTTVSLTPAFVNYLCWEMDEWLKRDIWDAIYLDECYEHPALNLEAGFSVRLPDGTEQPGVTNFQFRELMKRWRNLFTAHGKAPLLLAHLTYSWQYHGIVFCDAYLDGENRPIVSLEGGDWIDRTSRTQFEVVQNGRRWGVASFYMPFIAEGGFDNKTLSKHPRWQWRMARQAQSQFAHYETATVYEGQGAFVYRSYWKALLGWGAGDVSRASFHPYWDNRRYLAMETPDDDALVSLYRQPGKALVIASNRKREPVDLRIALVPGELGLSPGFKATDLDPTLRPPPGEDFVRGETSRQARDSRDALLGEGGEQAWKDPGGLSELDLEGPEERQAAKEEALAPRLEGTVLVVPVRGRDYRVIALE